MTNLLTLLRITITNVTICDDYLMNCIYTERHCFIKRLLMKLHEELADTEDKIVKARQFYNDTVMKYNTQIMMFPKSVFAGIFGFKKFDLLEATPEEKKSVKIEANTFQF